MSSSKCWDKDWADLEDTFNRKGYLLKTAHQQILLTLVGQVVGSDLLPWAIGNIPWKHRLSRGRGLVLSVDCAPADIVSYVSIYARPIHCLSHLCLHLVYPLMCSMQVSKGMIEKFQRNADSCSLEEEADFY